MAATPPSENVRLLERMYDAWHAGDLPRVLDLLDPEFEWVNPAYAVEPGTRHGHDGAQIEVAEQHLWTLRDGKILRMQWYHDADEARRAAGL